MNLFTLSDFEYSDLYGGCIAIKVDRVKAHIGIQKLRPLDGGYVVIGIDEITDKIKDHDFIVHDDRLLRIAREAHRRLGRGDFEAGYKPLVKPIQVTLEDIFQYF